MKKIFGSVAITLITLFKQAGFLCLMSCWRLSPQRQSQLRTTAFIYMRVVGLSSYATFTLLSDVA